MTEKETKTLSAKVISQCTRSSAAAVCVELRCAQGRQERQAHR